jgi:hypothetical protein
MQNEPTWQEDIKWLEENGGASTEVDKLCLGRIAGRLAALEASQKEVQREMIESAVKEKPPEKILRAGRVDVSVSYLLRLCMGFDKDHRLLAVCMKEEWSSGGEGLEVLVGGPLMPVVKENEMTPKVLVELTQAGIVLCSYCICKMMKVPTRYACQYWVCHKCGRTAATHPDGRLMSLPADGETRKLRLQVHRALEKHFLVMGEAYRWLKKHAGEEHVGFLDRAGCEKVLQLLGAFSAPLFPKEQKHEKSQVGEKAGKKDASSPRRIILNL